MYFSVGKVVRLAPKLNRLGIASIVLITALLLNIYLARATLNFSTKKRGKHEKLFYGPAGFFINTIHCSYITIAIKESADNNAKEREEGCNPELASLQVALMIPADRVQLPGY